MSLRPTPPIRSNGLTLFVRSQVSSGQCGRVPAVNNDLPLDSENLRVQIYVLCPNFKNYNHPSESTNSDVAGIRSALVCVGVLVCVGSGH